MRKFKNFLLYALLPILSMAFIAGCTETPDEPDTPTPPVVEKDSKIVLNKTSITASLAGGSYIIEYSIDNPHEGEKITAEPAENWVKDFNYGITGPLGFSVEANTSDAPRECVVTLKYRYAEDVSFVVKQNARISAGFTIENVTSDYFSYTVDVIPEDKATPFIMMSAHPDYIVASGFQDGEDYYEDDFAYFGFLGQLHGQTALDIMQIRAKVGDQRGKTVTGGASGVPYTFYCYYFDYESGALLSDVAMFTVETAKPELTNVDFDIEYEVEGPMVKANVVPVGYDGNYYFDMLNGLLVDSYMTDLTFLDSVERAAEYYWSNAIWEMSQGMSYDEIIAGYTCKGTNPDGTPKSYYEFELLANHDYYLFAFAMEEHGLCSSTPKIVKITTGDVEPSDNEITPAATFVTARTATISFTPSNNDHYVAGWETADKWATYGATDAERQAYLLKNNSYGLIQGPYTQSVLKLEPDTEYVLYAFGSRGGVATTDKIFTQTFRTKSGEAGEASIEFVDHGYYEAADLAEVPGCEFFGGDYYNGLFVLPIEFRITPNDYDGFIWAIYDWTGRYDEYNEQQYMDTLIWQMDNYGKMDDEDRFTYSILNNNSTYSLVAIVLDKNGQYSPVARYQINTSYAGARTNPDDFEAWWNNWQNGGGAELQSLVYEDEPMQLFTPKAQRNFYSEQEFEVENQEVAVDAIVASRVR